MLERESRNEKILLLQVWSVIVCASRNGKNPLQQVWSVIVCASRNGKNPLQQAGLCLFSNRGIIKHTPTDIVLTCRSGIFSFREQGLNINT